jgi:hypothetical protein
MIRFTRLTAAFAFAAGLTAAGMALAQTQPEAARPAIKPADPGASQPTYAVDPPPEGASGVYLPAAVLGYAKSAAGCVVVGCNDGPQGSGAPASAAPATPPAANPGSSDPR